MLRDEMLTLCEGYTLSGKTSKANVTNVIDFGETKVAPGVNKRGAGYLNIQITADITGGATPAIEIRDSADNSTFAQVAGTGSISLVGMKAGDYISILLPKVRRYLTVAYSAGTAVSAGAFTAWLGDNATKH